MAELKKPSVKSKVEAVLFSVGHKISLDQIGNLCRSRKEDVLEALKELQQEYEAKQSSLMLVEDGDQWKFSVRDHLISVVRKIVTETELTKSVMGTLAVIAFKYPILQSDLIKIRTNKAYDHLVELEKSGYITRQKHSRTNLIKLTEKFFRYFDLTEEKLKEQFKDFDSMARAIREKEEEVDKIKEEQRKKADDLKKEDDKIRREIESLDNAEDEFSIPLETYESKQESKKIEQPLEEKKEENQKIGDLEVVDVSKEKQKIKDEPESAKPIQNWEKPKDKIEGKKPQEEEASRDTPKQTQANLETEGIQTQEKKKQPRKRKGIVMTPEMEKRVDKRVEEIVSGKEKKDETAINGNSNTIQ